VTVPGTGVLLNNRLGRGAYLFPGHPNEVRPGRRPMHTLVAWMAADAGGALVALGSTPGGDGQVQWNMQLLSHLVDHRLDPQQAVAAPRFTVFPGSDADVIGSLAQLRCEPSLGDATLAALAQRGHNVVVTPPLGAGGNAQVICCDHVRGSLAGGADPRQAGCVARG
jgi:gamma-glutamyltranspeptidase/glutathione hydrolase